MAFRTEFIEVDYCLHCGAWHMTDAKYCDNCVRKEKLENDRFFWFWWRKNGRSQTPSRMAHLIADGLEANDKYYNYSTMVSKCEKIIGELVLGHFPELSSVRFKVVIMKDKDAFAYILDDPRMNNIIFIHRKLAGLSNTEVIKGCLAHELVEVCESRKKGFLGRIMTPFESIIPSLATRHERRIDQQVIDRGLGHFLYQFVKWHDKHYEEYDESDGLTAKEIKRQLKERNEWKSA